MQLINNMTDLEKKSKGSHRRKRGSRNRRTDTNNVELETPERTDSYTANKDLKCVKWRKFYVRPRYSPTAPHNSTQFIMDDQCLNYRENLSELSESLEVSMYSPAHNMHKGSDHRTLSCSLADSKDFFDSEIDSSEYMANDFESYYNQIRAEELSKLSKNELVDEILSMDDQIYKLEGRVSSFQKRLDENQTVNMVKVESDAKLNMKDTHQKQPHVLLSSLLEELERLKQENLRLKEEKEIISSSRK